MEQQYLQPQVYVKMIQELSATIGNLYTEMALQKAQYSELLEYATKLQEELDETKKSTEEPVMMQEEVINE